METNRLLNRLLNQSVVRGSKKSFTLFRNLILITFLYLALFSICALRKAVLLWRSAYIKVIVNITT